MRLLLVRPYPELRVARVLEKSFLHLEPLDLEIVAGGVPPDDEVSILDLSLEENPLQTFRTELARRAPDLVGFTGYSTQAHLVRELARLSKEVRPEAPTLVGGIHATIAAQDYASPHIDWVVRGEGGTAIRRLLGSLRAGRDPADDVQVLSPARPDFAARAAERPPEYPTFRDIPRPRRDLVDRSRYFSVWTSSPERRLQNVFPRVASVRTSIGCAFNCSFCTVHYMMNRRYVEAEPEDVVDEIEHLQEQHLYFVDDEMFLNTERVQRIAELLIARKVRKHCISWARSDTIARHPELFRLWKEAGLETVYVGIEAMDDSQLSDYNKRTTAETNRKAVQVLRDVGITLHASFLVNPDFTVEQFKRLEKNILELVPAEVTFTVMSPAPGTPLWQKHKDEFICDPYRFYDCMHTILKTRLPLPRFYAHFSRLYSLALRANPLRVNRVRVPIRDLLRAVVEGTRYILALRAIYKDYPAA